MKLELKHLASYLPYGLKVYVYGQTIFDNHICELKWLDASNQAFFDGDWNNISENSEYFKPILRPLSDLTKEIEVNGEKFVPIEFFEISDDENKNKEYDYGNIKLIRSLESLSKNAFVNDISYLPYGVVEKLYEWHFDIYGLIENNLAIDKKTIS